MTQAGTKDPRLIAALLALVALLVLALTENTVVRVVTGAGLLLLVLGIGLETRRRR